MAKKSAGRGRPTKYRDSETCRQATVACRLGATDADLAELFDVNEDTVNEWKKKHPEFSESIKRAKSSADQEVEDALFKRAIGYEHPAVQIMQYEGDPLVVDYVKRYPPSEVAGIFWLKNRQPHRWRDKAELEHSGGIQVVVDFGLKE